MSNRHVAAGLMIPLLLLAGCQVAPSAKPVTVKRSTASPIEHRVVTVPVTAASPVVSGAGDSRPPALPSATPMIMRPASPAASAKKLADGHDMPAVQGLLVSAETRLQQGQLDEASTSLERAQRLAPQSAAVYLKLAEIRLKQGRVVEAEQLARKGLAFSRSTAQQAALWRMISLSAERQGKPEAALQARQKAEQLEAQGDRG